MTTIKELLEQYNAAAHGIKEAFGYEEQWRSYEIEDETEYFWTLDGTDVVYMSARTFDPKDIESQGLYSAGIIGDTVLRTETHTMLIGDTQTDGNDFLMIFDNAKEIQFSEEDEEGTPESDPFTLETPPSEPMIELHDMTIGEVLERLLATGWKQAVSGFYPEMGIQDPVGCWAVSRARISFAAYENRAGQWEVQIVGPITQYVDRNFKKKGEEGYEPPNWEARLAYAQWAFEKGSKA